MVICYILNNFNDNRRPLDAYGQVERAAWQGGQREGILSQSVQVDIQLHKQQLFLHHRQNRLFAGLPIYLAVFAVEMVLTFVNMLFCWIPILSVVVTVICKGTILIIDQLYYICILTDLRNYREATVAEPDIAEVDYEIYETTDEAATDTQTLQADGSVADEQMQTKEMSSNDATVQNESETATTEEAQDQATGRTEQK